MKKSLLGTLLLVGGTLVANDNKEAKKENTQEEKEPIYKVVPRDFSVSSEKGKIYFKNDKAKCSADRNKTKATGGKVLKDVKCNVDKNDPNYKFWKKVLRDKSIKIYDKGTQDIIMSKIKNVEDKEKESKEKTDKVIGSDRIHFDTTIINNPANKPKDTKDSKKDCKEKKVIYVKKEICIKKPKDNKKGKDKDIDAIIQNMAKRIAENS